MKKRTTSDDLKELFSCAHSSVPPFCLEMLIMVWMVPSSNRKEKKMVISLNTYMNSVPVPAFLTKTVLYSDFISMCGRKRTWTVDSLLEDFAIVAYDFERVSPYGEIRI